MQAIIDPNKRIEYPDLQSYYPAMLLEVSAFRKDAIDKEKTDRILVTDGAKMSEKQSERTSVSCRASRLPIAYADTAEATR